MLKSASIRGLVIILGQEIGREILRKIRKSWRASRAYTSKWSTKVGAERYVGGLEIGAR